MPVAASRESEPKKNATEERLLDAALTLFASKGFAATSVREIIEATGVTRPVLYYYCESKQDLFQRIVRWKHDDAYRKLDETLAESEGAIDRLRAFAIGTFEFCAADPRVPQLMFQTTFGPIDPELSVFLDEIAQGRLGIVAGIIQEGLDSQILQGGDHLSLALLFCSIVDYHALTLSRLPDPEKRLTHQLAVGLVDAFLFGVASGKRKRPILPSAL